MQLTTIALRIQSEVNNPFEGVSPNIAPLGAGFDNALTVILGIIWGLVLVYTAVKLLTSFGKFAGARKQGHYEELGDHTDELKRRGIALVSVAGFGVIIGALLKVAGML